MPIESAGTCFFHIKFFMPQQQKVGGHINLPPVRPSGYKYVPVDT
jgi:hypothetical protein